MNRFQLLGYASKKPEMLTSAKGTQFCKLVLAVKNGYGKKEAIFIPIYCWKKVAENIVKYVDKGAHLLVEGFISVEYVEKKATIVRLNASFPYFLSSKGKKPVEKQKKGQPLKEEISKEPIPIVAEVNLNMDDDGELDWT